ncbi:MAG: MFS transporter [Chthonomonadales bacterium]
MPLDISRAGGIARAQIKTVNRHDAGGVYFLAMSSASTALHPRDRFGLSAYYFATFAGVGFSTPFLPLYWKSLGFTYLQIGSLVALASAAGAAMLVPAGAWSDRVRRRHPFIMSGSLLVSACFLLYPLVRSYAAFAVMQTLVGVGSTMSLAIAAALGADLFASSREGRSFAEVRAWGTIGFIMTMGAAAAIPGLVQGRQYFIITGLLYLGAGLSVLLVGRPAIRGGRSELSFEGVGVILRNANTRAFVVAYLLGYMALMPATANLSLYLKSFYPPASPRIIPLAYAISAGCELPFLFIMGWAADRFGRMLPLRICYIVLPVRLALYAAATVPTTALALQATHGLTFSVLAVVPFAFMADAAPPRYRATGQALLNAAGSAAYALGPLAAGRVADLVGIRNLYLFLAAIALTGSVILFGLVREPSRAVLANEAALENA